MEHSFFFTALERDRIAHLSPTATARPSLTTFLLSPLWNFVGRLIPDTVAPNSISLLGTMCTVQAYYILSQYAATQSRTATIIAGVLIIMSAACGALDGVQARQYRSGTALGDIFSKVCGSTNHIFHALIFFEVIGLSGNAPEVNWAKWYVLLSLQLVEFLLVLGRTADAASRNGVLAWLSYSVRESEISGALLTLMCVQTFVFPQVAPFMKDFLLAFSGDMYRAMVVASMGSLLLLAGSSREGGFTLQRRLAVAVCLALRCVPMVFLLPLTVTSEMSLISDAVVVSLLSIEVYTSHFAARRIHAAVIIICFLSLVNALFAIAATILYLTGLLADISYSTKTPLFVPIRNVFVDGVYDLCHIGHKKAMEYALRFGNRLVVGVLSDEDCVGYKRRPIMTTEERCREVMSCRFVSEVIPGSPVDGLTEEFLRKHNIHVVVCGAEYDKPDDKYYAVPRRMGILKTSPRTDGMSTSTLISRIQEANAEELVAKDKLRGESNVKE